MRDAILKIDIDLLHSCRISSPGLHAYPNLFELHIRLLMRLGFRVSGQFAGKVIPISTYKWHHNPLKWSNQISGLQKLCYFTILCTVWMLI